MQKIKYISAESLTELEAQVNVGLGCTEGWQVHGPVVINDIEGCPTYIQALTLE